MQQIVTYQGFYDDNLEFVHLERIQVISSMNPATTIGRHVLSSRFTANVRIAYMDYPTDSELMQIYTELISQVFSRKAGSKSKSTPSSTDKALASLVIECYKEIRAKFSIDDHRHYLFTPRDLTQWVFSLDRYDTSSKQLLIEATVYEGVRIFMDRLVGNESRIQFQQIIFNHLRALFNITLTLDDVFYVSSKERATNGLYTSSNLG